MKHREPNGLLIESLEPRLLMAGDFGTVHDVSMLSDVAVLNDLQDYAELHRLIGTHVDNALHHPRIVLDLTIVSGPRPLIRRFLPIMRFQFTQE
jgi:hypothetical protein